MGGFDMGLLEVAREHFHKKRIGEEQILVHLEARLAKADAHISVLIQKLAWIVDDWHSPLWNTQEGQELMSMLRALKNLPAPEPSRLWMHRCQRVEADRDLLLATLEAVEWMRQEGIGNVCPWCERDDFDDHAPDCQREVTLAKVKGE